MEYVGAKRRTNSVLKIKKAKSAVIDDFCQVTGAERKYAIRRLAGSRRCREHAGRGKTYALDATKDALADAESAFPFPLTAVHSDSGMEFINAHVLGYARNRDRPLAFTRSRPGNKNGNARVEQKNASVVREYFGCERIGRLELKKDMDALCAKISLYNNLLRPCKRIVSKTKRPDAHGFAKRYDKPATPLDRAAASECAGPAAIRRLTALRERANPIRLLEDIRRRQALPRPEHHWRLRPEE